MGKDYDSFSLRDFGDEDRVLEYIELFGLVEAFDGWGGEAIVDFELVETDNRSHAVDPGNLSPYPPKWDDLARLHWLTRAREAVSVVEFGAGYSTSVIAQVVPLRVV